MVKGFLPVAEAFERALTERLFSRIFCGDKSLWLGERSALVAERFGWVRSAERMLVGDVEGLNGFSFGDAPAADVSSLSSSFAGFFGRFGRVVLAGMGGSSLGAEAIASHLGGELVVLSSVHPARVSSVLLDVSREVLADTVLVASSKSGTTVETRSMLAVFERALVEVGLTPCEHVVVITDPGTPLASYARECGYRVVLGFSDVGGRFSALSPYGTVPAELVLAENTGAGVGVAGVLRDGLRAAKDFSRDDPGNPAFRLALALYELSVSGECVLSLPAGEGRASEAFVAWVTQLVAESSGKDGLGLLPVSGRDVLPVVREAFSSSVSLGERIMLWQFAVTAFCWLLDVNPFDQPDVESAKDAARRLLARTPGVDVASCEAVPGSVRELAGLFKDADYYALLCYVNVDDELLVSELRGVRDALQTVSGKPVALSFGPDYLHSVGQAHKGGAGRGGFLVVADAGVEDVPIPGESHSFGGLLLAQAEGDACALREHGKNVLFFCGDAVGVLLRNLRDI